MRVIIIGKNEGEWLTLCHQYGVVVPANNVHEVYMMPGMKTKLSEYIIDDNSSMATWISLKRPEWLREIWRQTPSFLHTDPDETFLKMTRQNGQP